MIEIPDRPSAPVVVAGHCCLDVIPDMSEHPPGTADLVRPGKLIEVGAATLAPGGAVSNAGLSLHRLGIPVRLSGKVGDDLFGRALQRELRTVAPETADGMIRAEGASTSYTIVVSPPGVDRIFFHHPGANDEFAPGEIDPDGLGDAPLFHFGYPPIMEGTYEDGGTALAALFDRIRSRSIPVSLDMAHPDPESPAGRVDWTAWLGEVLPRVDVFAPSFEELLFMLDRDRYRTLVRESGDRSLLQAAGPEALDRLSRKAHELGARLVFIKLGHHGLYLHTPTDPESLGLLRDRLSLDPHVWTDRQMLRSCFEADTVGTTGAGDATVAGLLAGLVRGRSPAEVLTAGVGVGAFSVEAPDATSGVPSWQSVQERIEGGWSPRPVDLSMTDWTEREPGTLWTGPSDRTAGR